MFNLFLINKKQRKQKLLQKIVYMKVLGTQYYYQKPNLHINQSPPQSQSSPPNIIFINQQSSTISQKKKPIHINKSKKNIQSDYPIQDFKQNNHKHSKQNIRLQQKSNNRNSNKLLHIVTPFSSVVNTKLHHKNHNHIQTHHKQYQSQSTHHQSKKNQQLSPSSSKHQSKKQIQKIIENKLNHILENKRKSISYRVHLPPKQNNFYQQIKKQSHHIQPITQFKQIDKKQQIPIQQDQQKTLIVNKQKSSQSFIIRKKINSNALESQRYQKPKLNIIDYERHYQNQKIIKDSKYQIHNQIISQGDKNDTHDSHLLSKYTYKPMEQQLRKIKQKQGDRQLSIKPHQIKGIKCLKVRVNKVLKAQQQFFCQKSFAQDSIQQNFNKQQKICYPQNITINQLNNQTKIKQINQAKQRQTTIEQILEIKNEQNNADEQNKKKPQHQNQIKMTNDQKKQKQMKQESPIQNIKNRKNRIASIRAIKNYYKKLDTEEKSSFINEQKQIKQMSTIRKKQKQLACLTHKIKWGTTSKKRLNSDRGMDAFVNQFIQFSIDQKQGHKKQNIIKGQIKKYNDPKNILDEKLAAIPTAKKKTMKKVEFQQEQGQTAKFKQSNGQITPKVEKNLERIFAQTINSRQFIDLESLPHHSGSKSLIIFEDPGISMIANNNSIHSPQGPLAVFQRQCSQFLSNQKYDISPVPVMRKRPCDAVQERCSQQNNPLQSLQELYFELKSHKSIHIKANEQFKVESLQELCQG